MQREVTIAAVRQREQHDWWAHLPRLAGWQAGADAASQPASWQVIDSADVEVAAEGFSDNV